jgi:hypothetical protein
MPEVRKQTFRRFTSKLRPTTSDADKLRMLRILYMMVYNAEDSLIPMSVELFHVLGEVLEGIPPDDLQLHRVDKDTFLRELAEN